MSTLNPEIRRHRSGIAICMIGLAVTVSVITTRSVLAESDSPAQVMHGAKLYTSHCAACHGARLEGQPDWRRRKPNGRLPAPPHDETGHTWHHPDQILFAITRDGFAAHAPEGYVTDMPGFDEVLSDDDIWAVLAFIKSQWPDHIRARRRAAAARLEGEARK